MHLAIIGSELLHGGLETPTDNKRFLFVSLKDFWIQIVHLLWKMLFDMFINNPMHILKLKGLNKAEFCAKSLDLRDKRRANKLRLHKI